MLESIIKMDSMNLKGNLLDIGFQNYGVVYNLYKNKGLNIDITYINEDKNSIEENFYDDCALFLTLSGIISKIRKRGLLEKINNGLKADGELHIWDIEKGYLKTFNRRINIYLPNDKLKQIYVKDFNIFKDTSSKGTINFIQKWFDIVETDNFEGIYYIKARKKRSEDINEIKGIATGD